MGLIKADYIWLDGSKPTQQLRSKTKVILKPCGFVELDTFPEWGFDGSSTYQATGHDSDLKLKPVCFYPDPVRGEDSYLVLCEVLDFNDKPCATNKRKALEKVIHLVHEQEDPWGGFEQEYTLYYGDNPLGWNYDVAPAPQGPYYCSVGSDVAFGRYIVEEHLDACIKAGLSICGTNAEVMPGQWEFQIGYRGEGDTAPILHMADEVWIARYLLMLIAEKSGRTVSFHVKPMAGDWNGAGMHTNFSTNSTRDPEHGMKAIEKAIEKLSQKHHEHIEKYGADNHLRLTGAHETCSINEFRSGIANRGCSIRIPRQVAEKGYGYFEDRRPGANANPYEVAFMLIKTVLLDVKEEKTE